MIEQKENQLQIKGQVEFMGVNIPVLEGGFGEDKKCVLAKDIAIIHNMETRRVNENIKLLIKKGRVKENIHYIDLKKSIDGIDLQLDKEFIRKSANIFVLSERGYSSLIKYMDDDKSWEVHDAFVDSYFDIREKAKDYSEEMKLIVQDMFTDFKTILSDFKDDFDNKLSKLEEKQEELEDYYKPTHKKKLGINSFIKSCLGDNATKENVTRATEQLLFILGDYGAYQEVPQEKLEEPQVRNLVYDICKNINISINKGIEIN